MSSQNFRVFPTVIYHVQPIYICTEGECSCFMVFAKEHGEWGGRKLHQCPVQAWALQSWWRIPWCGRGPCQLYCPQHSWWGGTIQAMSPEALRVPLLCFFGDCSGRELCCSTCRQDPRVFSGLSCLLRTSGPRGHRDTAAGVPIVGRCWEL